METSEAQRTYELEESAQGADLFRAPGGDLAQEDARDQAEASGWIPDQELPPPSSSLYRTKAHQESLLKSILELESVIARPATSDHWHQSVADSLERLGGSLRERIADIEAKDGLLEDIADTAPRLSGEVGALRREHAAILVAHNQALQAATAGGPGDIESVRRRVMALLGRLVTHRHRVTDLLYEAYSVDISAGD